jgi:hypothetical protein
VRDTRHERHESKPRASCAIRRVCEVSPEGQALKVSSLAGCVVGRATTEGRRQKQTAARVREKDEMSVLWSTPMFSLFVYFSVYLSLSTSLCLLLFVYFPLPVLLSVYSLSLSAFSLSVLSLSLSLSILPFFLLFSLSACLSVYFSLRLLLSSYSFSLYSLSLSLSS